MLLMTKNSAMKPLMMCVHCGEGESLEPISVGALKNKGGRLRCLDCGKSMLVSAAFEKVKEVYAKK